MNENPTTSGEGRSSVSTKIFLIVAIFSLPIGVLAYLLASNYTPQIQSAQLEIGGNAVQRPLMGLLHGLIQSETVLQGCPESSCAADLSNTTGKISAGFTTLANENGFRAADLKTTETDLAKKKRSNLAVVTLQAEWSLLASDSAKASTAEGRAELTDRYQHLASEVKDLISYVGDSSTLILDPDLDSYYLVDVTLLAMPEAASRISSAAAIGNKLVSGQGGAVEQAALATEAGSLQQNLARIAASNQTSFDADASYHGSSPSLQPKVSAAYQQYQTEISGYLALLKAIGTNTQQVTPGELAAQSARANDAALAYWNVAGNELDGLLDARIIDFQTSRVQALSFSALAVVIATVIAFLIGRSITRPLQELVRNLGPGATLLGVSVERIAETSQSKNPSPEEAAIICEELNAHADNMRKAVLELARHVEGAGAGRMLVNDEAKNKH